MASELEGNLRNEESKKGDFCDSKCYNQENNNATAF